MTRRPLLALALLAASCGVRSGPELRWVGQVTPTANPAQCPASRGVLIMRANQVTFAPDEGTWLLTGTADPGTLKATRSRPGADKKPYETTLDAGWTEAEVNGTYTTPRCTYRVTLTRG